MKILISNAYGGIGDFILSTPVIFNLKKNYIDSDIHIITSSKGFHFYSNIKEISNVILFEPELHNKMLSKYANKIKQYNFDLYIVLWNSFFMAALGFLAGIPIRVGSKSRLLYSFLYNRKVEIKSEKGDTKTHWIDILLDYIKILNLDIKTKRIYFPIVDFADERIREIIKEKIDNNKYFVISPAKDVPNLDKKNWPIKLWANLADYIYKNYGFSVIFTGSLSETPLITKIINSSKFNHINLAGQLDILELGALIKYSTMVICPDSGPVHIASALSVPVISIFGLKSDFPDRWKPISKLSEIIINKDYNCDKKICIKEKCQNFKCMHSIKLKEIIEKIELLLNKKSQYKK